MTKVMSGDKSDVQDEDITSQKVQVFMYENKNNALCKLSW